MFNKDYSVLYSNVLRPLYVKFGILLTYRLKDDFVLRSLYQAKKVSGRVFVFHDSRFGLFLLFFYWSYSDGWVFIFSIVINVRTTATS